MNKKLKIFFVILLIFLIGFIVINKSINFSKNQKLFSKYNKYFDENTTDFKVDEGMTLNFVRKNFDLNRGDIEKFTNYNINIFDSKMTINEFCDKENINCDNFIENINENIDFDKVKLKRIKSNKND